MQVLPELLLEIKLWGPKGSCRWRLIYPSQYQRVPSYDSKSKGFEAEVRRKHIVGPNVADHVRYLVDEDEDAHERQSCQDRRNSGAPDGGGVEEGPRGDTAGSGLWEDARARS